MLPAKRPKQHDDTGDEREGDKEDDGDNEDGGDEDGGDGDGDGGDGDDESTDTETEITQRPKSRKTLKRKRRATSPSRFGAALESLLSTTTTTTAPLSLRPEVARRQKAAKLERGAHQLLEGERREHEEKGRAQDAIGDWGAEGERALRKVAQRGVITLFNAMATPAPDPGETTRGGDQFMEMIRAGAVVRQG